MICFEYSVKYIAKPPESKNKTAKLSSRTEEVKNFIFSKNFCQRLTILGH